MRARYFPARLFAKLNEPDVRSRRLQGRGDGAAVFAGRGKVRSITSEQGQRALARVHGQSGALLGSAAPQRAKHACPPPSPSSSNAQPRRRGSPVEKNPKNLFDAGYAAAREGVARKADEGGRNRGTNCNSR